MQSRTWTIVILGVILLLIVVGIALLTWSREPAVVPSATSSSVPAASPTPTSEPLPSSTPFLPPTPAPFLYTIQEGDNLGSIAAAHGVTLEALIAANRLIDPNLIQIGQVLVIPGMVAPPPLESPTPVQPLPTTPPTTPLPTPTASGPPVIEISDVVGVGNLGTEAVLVRNQGGVVSLEGWTLSGSTGGRFVFPRLTLFMGGEVAIYSSSGQPTPLRLYWARSEPAWMSGDLITLRDQEGTMIDTYIVR